MGKHTMSTSFVFRRNTVEYKFPYNILHVINFHPCREKHPSLSSAPIEVVLEQTVLLAVFSSHSVVLCLFRPACPEDMTKNVVYLNEQGEMF